MRKVLFFVFQNISGLTVESLTNRFERREPNRFGFAIFEDGNIGHRYTHLLRKFGDTHFSFGQHDIKVNENGHMFKVRWLNHFLISYRWHSAPVFAEQLQTLQRVGFIELQ